MSKSKVTTARKNTPRHHEEASKKEPAIFKATPEKKSFLFTDCKVKHG